MKLYYLDPNDEPRTCRGCSLCVDYYADRDDAAKFVDESEWCDGFGQLGNPDGPQVRIVPDGLRGTWHAVPVGQNGLTKRTRGERSKSAALEAARKAYREE